MKSQGEQQLLLFATLTPNGNGGWTIVPRKPVAECGPSEAAQMLGVCRSTLSNLLDQPQAQKLIRWRWLTEAQGKRVYDTQSLLAYREATADPEFGCEDQRAEVGGQKSEVTRQRSAQRAA